MMKKDLNICIYYCEKLKDNHLKKDKLKIKSIKLKCWIVELYVTFIMILNNEN